MARYGYIAVTVSTEFWIVILCLKLRKILRIKLGMGPETLVRSPSDYVPVRYVNFVLTMMIENSEDQLNREAKECFSTIALPS